MAAKKRKTSKRPVKRSTRRTVPSGGDPKGTSRSSAATPPPPPPRWKFWKRSKKKASSSGGGTRPPWWKFGKKGSSDSAPSDEFSRWNLNGGIISGIFWSLIAGLVTGGLFRVATDGTISGSLVGIGVAGTYFFYGLHTVPVAYRGVYLFLGRRVRVGKEGKGFEEGLRWSPIPLFNGLASIKNENTKWRFYPDPGDKDLPEFGKVDERGLDIGDFAKASADNESSLGKVMVDLFLLIQFRISDSYRYQSQEDPVIGLLGLFERAARHFISKHTPEELIDLDKQKMSEEIKRMVIDDMTDKGDKEGNLGLEIGKVRVTNITMDEEVVAALKKGFVEGYERKAEAIEAEAQVEQVKKLRAVGVSANLALAGRIVSQEKPGAHLNHHGVEVSFPEELPEGMKEVSKNISDGLASIATIATKKKSGGDS